MTCTWEEIYNLSDYTKLFKFYPENSVSSSERTEVSSNNAAVLTELLLRQSNFEARASQTTNAGVQIK
jgi:hypothetical protein